ncbi:hypothetical protein [Roseibium sp.]|uniref:hypothetical protein n=1 Tax=Roseibium sp. TaxID=1936156 RepID=UPI003D11B135
MTGASARETDVSRRAVMQSDGNGYFTRKMGIPVTCTGTSMVRQSWRYTLFADEGKIRKMLIEPDFRDEPPGVPVEQSGAAKMLEQLCLAGR